MREHLKSLWGSYWPLPGAIPIAYAGSVIALGGFRPAPLALAFAACVLAYASIVTRRIYLAVLPFGLVTVAYDALRYARSWITGANVAGCEMHNAELFLFRVRAHTTLQDWVSTHQNAPLDILCAVPYFAFLYVVAGYSIYLWFVDRGRMHVFLWAYAIGNLLAFACWLVVPAAPPWYVHAHGCAIDLDARPSAAGLARADNLLHTHYFENFYSRSNFIFGALPSLHCAYPLMGFLVSASKMTHRNRIIHVSYVLLMAYSAMYLDHHWTLDVIAGWGLAVISVVVSKELLSRVPVLLTKVAPAPVKIKEVVGTPAGE